MHRCVHACLLAPPSQHLPTTLHAPCTLSALPLQAGLVKVFDDPGMRPRVTVAKKLEPAHVVTVSRAVTLMPWARLAKHEHPSFNSHAQKLFPLLLMLYEHAGAPAQPQASSVCANHTCAHTFNSLAVVTTRRRAAGAAAHIQHKGQASTRGCKPQPQPSHHTPGLHVGRGHRGGKADISAQKCCEAVSGCVRHPRRQVDPPKVSTDGRH